MAVALTKKERAFILTVKEFYRRHKRRKLPWRQTKSPYHILVSEIMLQQTQVERVIPKYDAFLREFPTLEVLARAQLGTVLRAWQGLGYNRRAKMLHDAVKVLVRDCGGQIPTTIEGLTMLPGIGVYTAGAVMAFAFNIPVPIIETNIRSVYLHHFFEYDTDVKDIDILPILVRTLDRRNPRAWYYALMDYGSYIKKMYGNPNIRSQHYVRQSRFQGSDRQIRGTLIRLLGAGAKTRTSLHMHLKQFSDIRIDAQLQKLKNEGLISYAGRQFSLRE